MKNRHRNIVVNPSSSAMNQKSVIDRQLLRRVEQYLVDNNDKAAISIPVMTEELRSQYREYTRKKMIPFRTAVEKAYSAICKKRKISSDEDTDAASLLEAKHLSKRCKSASDLNDDDNLTDDSEDYVEYKDTNLMNSVMTDLYAKKMAPQVPAAANVPHSTPVTDPSVGEIGFVIDRTGSKTEKLNSEGTDSAFAKMDKEVVHKSDVIVIEDCMELSGVNGSMSSVSNLTESETKRSGIDPLQGFPPFADGVPPASKSSSSSRKRKRPLAQENTDVEPFAKKKSTTIEVQQSTTKLSDFGGSVLAVLDVIDNVLHMKQSVLQRLNITFPCGILLHGPPGCGKTLLANAIAGEMGCAYIKMSGTQLVSGVSGESEERIRDLFSTAVEKAPCIIFLDEIDSIAPKRETASKDMERRIVAQLLTCMDDLCSRPDVRVIVIGATNRPDSLDSALRRAGRFDQEVSVGIPDEVARRMILKVLCENVPLAADVDICHLAQLTPGYVGVDLRFLVTKAGQICGKRLLREAEKQKAENGASETTESATEAGSQSVSLAESRMQCSARPSSINKLIEEQQAALSTALRWLKEDVAVSDDNICITLEDFKLALKQSQPSSKREGFATVPNVTWDQIGALQSVHKELEKSIIWSIKYPDCFRSKGAGNCGILLTGPPGNGKTLVAKAVANELGLNFISVKGPELLSMYVGESEKAVRQVFRRASDSSPCVIFFDELDSLFQMRSNSETGGNKVSVVNQLLTELDGFDGRKQVYIIGATNRLDMIDPAFLRPGRFDKTIYVGLPNADGRVDILQALSRSERSPYLAPDVDLEKIARDPRCDGMSGADLGRILIESEGLAMEEIMDDPVLCQHPPVIVVNQRHLELMLDKVTPSVKDHMHYEEIRKKFGLKASS